jgi:FMN phosphatase YigB (HAD superfamily)
MKYKVILFDLDDTLLRNDVDQFLSAYFRTLTPHISHYFPKEDFYHIFHTATRAVLMAKPSSQTLLQVFIDAFEKNTTTRFSDIAAALEKYYETDFSKISNLTRSVPQGRKAVETAYQKSEALVLATIPIFPERAILERLKWAGIDASLFKLITHIENMHASKPQPEYYAEIAEKMHTKPKDCLMIGNDHTDDLVAKSVGMVTFLVSDYEKNRDSAMFRPDHYGSMKELVAFLEKI